MEIWKEIKEFNDYYVSNLGKIKSVKFRKEKILKYIKNNKKYLYIDLCKNGIIQRKQVSILVYEIFHNYKLKLNEIVHHKDENINNNNINNLEKMNKSEHTSFHKKDKYCGKNHSMFNKHHSEKTKKNIMINSNHKLEKWQVKSIYQILNSPITKKLKISQKEIAEVFGVSQNIISNIKNKKIWKYLEGGLLI